MCLSLDYLLESILKRFARTLEHIHKNFIHMFTVHTFTLQSTEQTWPVDWNYTHIQNCTVSVDWICSRLKLFLKIFLHIFSRLNLNLRIFSEKTPSSSQELQPFINGNWSISCLQPLTTYASLLQVYIHDSNII